MADMHQQHLVSLDDGDWQVADGEPDLRGWSVFTADHHKIGEVDDLLADPDDRKVRFLAIDLDDNLIEDDSDHVVHVAVSRARIQDDDHEVILDVQFAGLEDIEMPASEPDGVGREADVSHEDQVRVTRAAEELRVGKRTVDAGGVNVRKRVETEHVQEPVSLRADEVTVERRPVEKDRPGSIGASEIRIPVTREEAVVEKRPVVKEEVVITKRPVEARETVETDIKKEEVDVEPQGDVRTSDRSDKPTRRS